jgi:hypothetical protein
MHEKILDESFVWGGPPPGGTAGRRGQRLETNGRGDKGDRGERGGAFLDMTSTIRRN